MPARAAASSIQGMGGSAMDAAATGVAVVAGRMRHATAEPGAAGRAGDAGLTSAVARLSSTSRLSTGGYPRQGRTAAFRWAGTALMSSARGGFAHHGPGAAG